MMSELKSFGARCRPIWQAVWLLLIAAVAVGNVIHGVRKTRPVPAGTDGADLDRVMRFERRVAPLRAKLATSGVTGTIGYIGDIPSEQLSANDQGMEDYYLTQFVLVPLVLDRNPDAHEWAVGQFRRPVNSANLPAGWKVVEDLGEGVLLLRKGGL